MASTDQHSGYRSKNPNTTTPATQAVILDVTMPKDGVITAEFNGKKFEHSLGELLEGSVHIS